MTAPPALADIDGDGSIDGVLRRIKDGTGISMSLSQNILTIDTSGGVAQFSDGVPSNSNGENNDINIDYTNGNIYRKVSGSWSLFDQIPSIGRIGRFVANYSTSSFSSGNFGLFLGNTTFTMRLFLVVPVWLTQRPIWQA